jgi:tRNA (adenine37-N6)-methyltransferase
MIYHKLDRWFMKPEIELALNETPLLDIKPYVPLFDARETSKIGWFEKRIQNVHKVKADKSVY